MSDEYRSKSSAGVFSQHKNNLVMLNFPSFCPAIELPALLIAHGFPLEFSPIGTNSRDMMFLRNVSK